MQQTLLAVLCLALASLVALNVQRARVNTQGGAVAQEVEMMAAAVATNALEFMEGLPFDDRTRASVVRSRNGLPLSPVEFSAVSAFGRSSCGLSTAARIESCRDLDDLHGLTNEAVSFTLRDGQRFPLQVSLRFDYVEGGPLGGAVVRTYHKRAVLRVTSTDLAAQNPRFAGDLLRIERVFSYDARKVERDYRALYNAPPPGMGL